MHNGRGARKDLKRPRQTHFLIAVRQTANATEEVLCKVAVPLGVPTIYNADCVISHLSFSG